MDFFETLRLSLEGLRANKMRSFLTMLGIIIGIGSVIGITTIGHAMTKSVNKAFDSIGNTAVQISTEPNEPKYSWEDMRYEDGLTVDMLKDLKENLSDIVKDYSLYGAGGSGKINQGDKSINVDINSTTSGSQYIQKIDMIGGRFLTDEDNTRSKYVAVISDKVVDKIFNGDIQSALGSEIKVKKADKLLVLTVVGVYKWEKIEVGVLGGSGDTSKIYIPYNVGEREINGWVSDYFSYAAFVLKNSDNVEEDCQSVSNYLKNKYFSKNDRVKIDTNSALSQMKEMTSTMDSLQIAISAIAAISLLVGGIGVMNILLVSVTERTREIGIRKALGATRNDIRFQFITESVIICIVGGIFGIFLGGTLGILGSSLLKMRSLPSITSVVVAVGFSMLIGIFFGYYPANKAAKLDPIEALRYE